MSGRCYRCGAATGEVDAVGRRDTCLRCGSELHCCRNCRFYDRSYHNECREPQAERQVEKERSNFCEYFSLGAGVPAPVAGGERDARADLERLFRKRNG